jgi:hypothetical protein
MSKIHRQKSKIASTVALLDRPPLSTFTPAPFDVDVVYTWVANTPQHMAARNAYTRPTDNNVNRYTDNDELRHSIRSVYAHIPWVRRIYIIVADGQCPAWLTEDTAELQIPVYVAPHSLLYTDPAHLPTFNSQSIECHLHRLPHLAEHFIYFNDDMFVSQSLSWRQFFTPEGVALYHFHGYIPNHRLSKHNIAWQNNLSVLKTVFPNKTHSRKYPAHQCVAMRKSSFEEVSDHSTIGRWVARTSASRFRENRDLYLIGLLVYWNMYTGKGKEHILGSFVENIKDSTNMVAVAEAVVRSRPALMCLGDDMTRSSSANRVLVKAMLGALYPVPSPAERL